MNKNILLTISVLVLFPIHEICAQKMNTILIEFTGHKYDSLNLNIYLDDNKVEIIQGISKDGFTWQFVYPDSIYSYVSSFSLDVPQKVDSIRHNIGFHYILNGDTLKVGNYSFGKLGVPVKAHYNKTDTESNIPTLSLRTQKVIRATWISDAYDITTDDKELLSSIEGLWSRYSMFYTDKYTYEENLNRFVELTKKYPDSHNLIGTLAGTLGAYQSKNDITKVFNCFSEKNKQSYFGQKINRYLTRVDTVFKNQVLPTWDTGVPEAIIQDSSNYNLIIFSASWCGYCHRQIPILKEVYHDLGKELIMTYISVDKKDDADKWKFVMQKNEITWRSLVALDKYKIIYDEYAFFGIPHSILVHPFSMKMEVLDVRKQEDKRRLYELIKTEPVSHK